MYRHAALFGYVGRYGVQSRGDDARPGESCSDRGAVVDRGVPRRARGSR
jgi:hypothetical protein